ncbi:MAG: BamA/TamA family outer membrane protein [Deltaproteobacteria bacterium]
MGIGYNLYYRSEKLDKVRGSFERFSNTFGGYMHYSYKLGINTKINICIGCDLTKLRIYEEAASMEVREFLDREGFDFKEYYYSFLLNYNSLDKSVFPSSGLYNNFLFRISLPFSNLQYYYLNYNLSFYKKVSENLILNALSFIYYGNKYGNTSSYPFFKNFFMKGNIKVRGLKGKYISPRDSSGAPCGGFFLFNFGLCFILPNLFGDYKTIRTALFFDSGQVCNINDEQNFNLSGFCSSIKFSFGLSLICCTPFGLPIELSLAYPLNIKNTDREDIFSLTLGI